MDGNPDNRTPNSILIVEDDEAATALLTALLAADGYAVATASDGAEALEMMREPIPSVVLLDIGLPGMDGLTVLRHMRDDPVLSSIPTIVVTGAFDEETVTKCRDLGASDYIKKPFDWREMRFRIAAQIRLHASDRHTHEMTAQLEAIAMAAHDAIMMIDHTGEITHWNMAAERMFGYSRAEVMGKNLHALIAPKRFHEAHYRAFPHFEKTGDGTAIGKTLELAAVRKNGEEFDIELSLSSTCLEGKWCAVGIIRDITASLLAQKLLAENQQKYQSILDNVAMGVALISPRMEVLEMNRAMRTWFPGVEPTGRPICFLSFNSPPRDGLCDYCPTAQTLRDGKVHESIANTPQEGGIRNYRIVSSPIRDARGEITAAIEMVEDITERGRLEAELAHARKLEAVGQLAAGIAHEINTPAQFVGDSVHYLKDAFDEGWVLIDKYRAALETLARVPGQEELMQAIHEAEAEADLPYRQEHVPKSFERCFDGLSRISSIVNSMKEFAHPDRREKSPADLNKALDATLTIAKNEYKYVADVEASFAELPQVLCHVGDLNQVFLNLIVNAAHAIADVVGNTGTKGVIRVRTSIEGGDTVCIEVEDSGCGIPAAIRERVFEPFFTTKAVGKGSGQGLAIARSIIVDKHHGTLTFQSREGGGTTFAIRVPVDGGDLSSAEVES